MHGILQYAQMFLIICFNPSLLLLQKKPAVATFAVCQCYSFHSLISAAKKFTLELQHDFIEEIIKFTAHILIILLARLSVVRKSWLLLYFFFKHYSELILKLAGTDGGICWHCTRL